MDPALQAVGPRRSFLRAGLAGLHLAPPANAARLNSSTAEPRTKPGPDQRGSLVGEVGARTQPIGGTNTPGAQHEYRPDRHAIHRPPSPRDVPIDHPYRRRWCLPIIGPTATCILNHLGDLDDDSNWSVTPALELAVALGLGKGTGRQSPLIRSLDRLTRFGFGHFDVKPGQNCDPVSPSIELLAWSPNG